MDVTSAAREMYRVPLMDLEAGISCRASRDVPDTLHYARFVCLPFVCCKRKEECLCVCVCLAGGPALWACVCVCVCVWSALLPFNSSAPPLVVSFRRVLDQMGTVVQLPYDLCEQHSRYVGRHGIQRLKRYATMFPYSRTVCSPEV